MVTPDPISEWSQDEISSWINGLDIGLDRYKESLKYLTGDQLLTAKYTDLYQYGIDKGSVHFFRSILTLIGKSWKTHPIFSRRMTQPDFWSRNSGKVIHTNFMGTFVLDEFSPKFAIRLVPEIGFFCFWTEKSWTSRSYSRCNFIIGRYSSGNTIWFFKINCQETFWKMFKTSKPSKSDAKWSTNRRPWIPIRYN